MKNKKERKNIVRKIKVFFLSEYSYSDLNFVDSECLVSYSIQLLPLF